MVYKMVTRSKGIVIFAITLIAFGTFSAFLLVLSITLVPFERVVPEFNHVAPSGILSMPVFWLSTGLSLLISILWIISGMGVLHLWEWARKCLCISMSVYIINMLVNIVLNVFMAQEVLLRVPIGFLVTGILASLAYYLSVIYFFSHPNVVRQFKYKSRTY